MPLSIDDLKDRLNPANDALERLIALNPPIDPVTGLSMRQGTPAAAAYRLALDETLARFGSVKAFREALGEDAERLAPIESDVGLAGTPVSLDFFPTPPIPKRKPEIRLPNASIQFPDIGAPEPEGAHWTAARDQMMADAHALIFAAKTIEDSDDGRMVGALRGYCEDEERSRLFSRLVEALKPPPKVSAPPPKRCSRRRTSGRDDKVVRLFNDT